MSSLSPRGGVKGSGRGVPARGVLAALLLLLAGLKLSAPGATALSTGVAVAECVLALLLLFARTAQWGGLVGIGGFVGAGAAHSWRLLSGDIDAGCGCLGALDAPPGSELLLSAVIVILALQVVRSPRSTA